MQETVLLQQFSLSVVSVHNGQTISGDCRSFTRVEYVPLFPGQWRLCLGVIQLSNLLRLACDMVRIFYID